MKSIVPKLPDELLRESGHTSDEIRVRRAERLAELSGRVREESIHVNAEFARIELDPDA